MRKLTTSEPVAPDRRSHVFVSVRTRRNALTWAALICFALALSYLAVRRYAPFLTDPAGFQEFVQGFGAWAPLAFVAVQAAQVIVAPIPGQVTCFVAGYLFGAVAGAAYSILGATIGSAVAFWLSRRFGRAYVERVVTTETLARFDNLAESDATLGLFLAFLVPGLPDDAICFVGGLTEIPLRRLVVVALLGRTPSFVLMAVAGSELASDRVIEASLIALALMALAVTGYYFRGRLTAWITRTVGP